MKFNNKKTFYATYLKRFFDVLCAVLVLVVFAWLYLLIAGLVRINLGSPILFKQKRPGLNEKIFYIYKFRTMTDERDERGALLPDKERITMFGRWLRKTSLDELPEIINILNGSMSLIGPRPLLVRDMVFMSEEQRRRHTVRPGLSGLAQVNGRNAIGWEEKLSWDLEYIEKITFISDVKIVFQTIYKAFFKQEGINREGTVSDIDFGDYLLGKNLITQEEYDKRQEEAKMLFENS